VPVGNIHFLHPEAVERRFEQTASSRRVGGVFAFFANTLTKKRSAPKLLLNITSFY